MKLALPKLAAGVAQLFPATMPRWRMSDSEDMSDDDDGPGDSRASSSERSLSDFHAEDGDNGFTTSLIIQKTYLCS